MSLRLPTIFLFLCLHSHLFAQQPYYFTHYQVEDGLSNDRIESIEMDKDGFMWFGTIDGLNRFNGYNFKVFRKNITNKEGLQAHTINCLLSDRNNRMWVGTENGLFIYDGIHESFREIAFAKGSPVKAIKMDAKGRLWVVARKSLFRFDPSTQHVQCFDKQGIQASSICILDDETLYISGTKGYLHKFSISSNRHQSYPLFSTAERKNPASHKVRKIYNSERGVLFIATENHGIKTFDIKTNTCKNVITENPDGTRVYGFDFMHYNKDEYWIATEAGIIRYNIETGQYSYIQLQYNNPFSLSDNTVYALFKDKEGGVWAGTRFGGINYCPYPYTRFNKYFPMTGSNSLKGNGVHEIRQDGDGNLWIGTEQAGLNKLNMKTKKFEHFIPGKKKGSISFSDIHGLLVDGSNLWIGTLYNGLDLMDIRTGKVTKHYTLEKGLENSDFIISLIKTSAGDIFAGTYNYFYKYNQENDSFKVIPALSFYTNCAAEIAPGILSIGTMGKGIFIYDTKQNKIISNFRHQPNNPNSLNNNFIHGQLKDSKGIFWYTTREGLCEYNPIKKEFTAYTTQTGLPSNFLLGILEDKHNNLWISSTSGLIRFNTSTKKSKLFTTAEGILNDQFNINSTFKDSSGNMYFGSVKGLISFNPDKFSENKIIPPIHITNLQVNNKDIVINNETSQFQQSIIYEDGITLDYKQSTLGINFSALSYTSPLTNQYAYMMDGLDKDWTYLKTNRTVYYTQLPAGTYTFRVKGSNSSGRWNNKERTLQITIRPPYWASKTAYAFYIVTGIALLITGILYYNKTMRLRSIRKLEKLQLEKEKELYKHKIGFFTDVAHEIRTPLTLIQGPMESIMENIDEVPSIRTDLIIMERNTARLLELTNQLLDFRQTEVQGFSLSFKPIDIAALLKNTHINFSSLARLQNLAYHLHLPVNEFNILADEDALLKIFNNLYSNAIKYASTIVTTNFIHDINENTFTIEVSNDGFIIPEEKSEQIFEPFFRLRETYDFHGTGIGLAISRNLAELHKGSLIVKKTIGEMNVFVLTLPVNRTDYGLHSAND
ncbi:MAG TPA: two-component regulator propeller domain-containing protein [Arachidicoccus sp.]|nr:two-component regulator propeller domain-containing protein [Arachidicoccus sp.]